MRLALCCLAALASACGPPGDTDGLIMLDPDAHAAGLTLSVGGWTGATHMPLSVRELEEVSISGEFGTRRIAGRAGFLGLVVGSAGSVDWRRLGDEVDPDALEVSGSEDAVVTLGTRLGAQKTDRGVRRWQLRDTELLARSAWGTDLAGIDDVQPVLILPVRPLELAAFPVAPRTATVLLLDDTVTAAGLYTTGDETLLLDTSGGFTAYRNGCVSSSGRFRAEADSVVLMPASGPARTLRSSELKELQ